MFSDYNGIILKINSRKIAEKSLHIWRVNNTFLNSARFKEEVSREIKNDPELNENENTASQNGWHAAKAVLRGKFIALTACIRKEEKI